MAPLTRRHAAPTRNVRRIESEGWGRNSPDPFFFCE
jgi:hypothetical protein